MPYIVNNTDGSLTVTIQDSVVDASTYSLALIGRNVSNYGQYFAQNTIRHLENFASTTAPSPSNKLIGQLWYDKNEQIMRVWDGVIWRRNTNIIVGPQNDRPDFALTGGGTAYFNTTIDKLEIHNGADYREASYAGEVTTSFSNSSLEGFPTKYGTRVRNLFLKDDNGIKRPVTVMTYVKSVDTTNTSATNLGHTSTSAGQKETIMALWSDAQFTIAADTETLVDGNIINYFTELTSEGGIAYARTGRAGGLILPGMNIRSEYENVAVGIFDTLYVNNTIGSVTHPVPSIYVDNLYVLEDLTLSGSLTGVNAEFSGSVTIQGDLTVYGVSDFYGDITLHNGAKLIGTATQALYADLAEIYAADENYKPGTVVQLGGSAEITQTTTDASTDLFGVISTDPAYLMNSGAKGLPVAFAGRLPVFVNGPVAKGERLVSSDIPGVARAIGTTEYDPRIVIGRALESKPDNGIGTIEVVVGTK